MASINITQGTATAIGVDTVGTVNYQIVKLDYGAAGNNSLFTGTLPEVSNLVKGTILALANGTISAGTVNAGTITTGTVDSISQFPPNSWGTTVTTGTTTLGTIKPAVAGSAIFVTDLIISAGTTTTLVVGMGGTSTPLIGTLSFNSNGGLVTNFRVPGSVTAGSALVYQQSVGGALSITAQGFVR